MVNRHPRQDCLDPVSRPNSDTLPRLRTRDDLLASCTPPLKHERMRMTFTQSTIQSTCLYLVHLILQRSRLTGIMGDSQLPVHKTCNHLNTNACVVSTYWYLPEAVKLRSLPSCMCRSMNSCARMWRITVQLQLLPPCRQHLSLTTTSWPMDARDKTASCHSSSGSGLAAPWLWQQQQQWQQCSAGMLSVSKTAL